MSVPSIVTLRNQASSLIEPLGDSVVDAILTGSVAAANVGTPLIPGQPLQALIEQTRGLQYQPRSDVLAIQIDQWMRFLQAVASSGSVALSGYPGAAALRARDVLGQNQIAYLIYAAVSGDNGGGWFVYDATSTATDDGVDVVKPDSVDAADPGRWLRNS